MAQELVQPPKSSLTKAEMSIVDALADGQSVAAIAKRLAPEDKKKRYRLRRKIWYRIRYKAEFQAQLAVAAKARALQEGVGAVPAVGRRAKRGRVDAFKALNELSGLHNPKVQHEHSGDIKVTLATMPRPKAVETVDGLAEEVADAEVVE